MPGLEKNRPTLTVWPGKAFDSRSVNSASTAVLRASPAASRASGSPCFGGHLKNLGKQAAGRLAVGLDRLFGSRAGETFGILTYHRVTSCGKGVPPATWNVTPPRFRAQLEGLLSRGYQPWPLRQVVEFSGAGRSIPRKTFVVTFDDGYENLYRNAWPVLREFRVPATVFLATAYLDNDGPFPFDDWPAAGSEVADRASWQPLTTAQCIEMLEDGLVDLGTHTHTHAVFRGRPDALRQDLSTSLDLLRSRFGLANATFAFPFGIAGPDLAAAARQAGVLCGLTTKSALVTPRSDPFAWGRFYVAATDTSSTLAAKLDGWYSFARDLWRQLPKPARASRETVDQHSGE